MRALNKRPYFCYVNLETVQFYLHQRKMLSEYDENGVETFMHGRHYTRLSLCKDGWCTASLA